MAEAAEQCAQYYMNHRWLGGTLTNWKTVSGSISRLKKLDEQLEGDASGFTKKERLNLERERAKLDASLGGIREMGGLPDMLFVIDTNKEELAILEAKKLGIPVIGIIDTNCDPDPIDFPIPANDDAARAITLYCELIADAALDGMTQGQSNLGVDMGAAENPVIEPALIEAVEATPAEAAPAEAAPAEAAKAEPAADAVAETSDESATEAKEEKTEG